MATTPKNQNSLPCIGAVLGEIPARSRVAVSGSQPVPVFAFARSVTRALLSLPCRVGPVACSCGLSRGLSACSCPSLVLAVSESCPPVFVWLPLPAPVAAPRFSFVSSFVPLASVVRCRSSVSSFPGLAAALSAVGAVGAGCRVGVVGSREFPALGLVSLFVGSLPSSCVVVSGAARGVDRVAASSARSRGLEVSEFAAAWGSQLGRSAGVVRNRELVSSCSVVVVFRSLGASPGSDSAASLARSCGVPVFVVSPPSGACSVVQPSLF